jgi:hypothetical protein
MEKKIKSHKGLTDKALDRPKSSETHKSDHFTWMSAKEQLEFICWMTDRYDALRASTANRAAIVVSVDAVLMASITFLFDKILARNAQFTYTEKVVFFISVSVFFLSLILSLIYATSGIVILWGNTQQLYGSDKYGKKVRSLFFHSFHTVQKFKSYSEFSSGFKTSSVESLLDNALGNLWLMENLFNRYRGFLVWAIRLLLFSLIPFMLAVAVLVVNMFNLS